jgi:hypothetical protein
MSYGISLWNSSGALVYSSQYKTVQTVDMGELTISDLLSHTIQFTPVPEEPELWIGGQGYVTAVDINGMYSRLFGIYAGNFVQNANGDYYQFTIQAVPFAQIPATPDKISGTTKFPWIIPWVVFI